MNTEQGPLNIFLPGLFQGNTVLVTGGGRGIGKQVSLAFGRLGANVVIASRNPENLDPAAEEIEATGAACLAVPTNIREVDQVESLLEKARVRFGAIDFLVNNAGGQFPARPTDISDRGWRAVVDLNLNGTWNMCSRVGPHMIERGSGCIVNIVHIYSFGRGAAPFAHSGAARAGVVNLTRSLAAHWAPFYPSVPRRRFPILRFTRSGRLPFRFLLFLAPTPWNIDWPTVRPKSS